MKSLRFEDHRSHAEALISAVLRAGDAAAAVLRAWPADLPGNAKCRLLACGKASLEMAGAAIEKCGEGIKEGVVTAIPERMAMAGKRAMPARIAVFANEHPTPTHRNVTAARMAAALVKGAHPNETLIAMISGGGSAHLTIPGDGLTLADVAMVSTTLMTAGATIREINTVRKHIEKLKGGRLAALCPAHRIVAFVLSDVIGDAVDVIASGPFEPDPTTYADGLAVLQRYGIAGQGSRIAAFLRDGIERRKPETPKPGDAVFVSHRDGGPPRVETHIVASNATVVDAAEAELKSIGFGVIEVRKRVEGESAEVAREFCRRAIAGASAGDKRPAALLLGGETTVKVGRATGKGGPSQEFALAAAEALRGVDRTAVMTFSTDGRDGPTEAAGAIVTGSTWDEIRAKGIDPARAMANHDSFTALQSVGALVKTGATGTNLNHVAAVLLY